jgi:hypothetical protein
MRFDFLRETWRDLSCRPGPLFIACSMAMLIGTGSGVVMFGMAAPRYDAVIWLSGPEPVVEYPPLARNGELRSFRNHVLARQADGHEFLRANAVVGAMTALAALFVTLICWVRQSRICNWPRRGIIGP